MGLARRFRAASTARATRALTVWEPPEGPRQDGRARCLVLPPAPPGSLGDEAFVAALGDALVRQGWRALLLEPGRAPWPGTLAAGYRTSGLYGRVPGRAAYRLLEGMGPTDRLLVVGADVLDGLYPGPGRDRTVAFALAAHAAGAVVDVVSFSLDDRGDAPPDLCRLLAVADRVVARDRASARLCGARFGREAAVAADAAFLLEPVGGVAGSDRAEGGPVVLGTSRPAEDAWRAVAGPGRSLAEELAWAMGAVGLPAVRTLVHDTRPDGGDVAAVRRVAAACERRGIAASPLAPVRPTPAGVRLHLGGCEVVVAGRLHLAIAALAAGTPVVGLAYSQKWQGLWELLALPPQLLLTPGPGLGEQVAACVEQVRADASSLRARFSEAAERARVSAQGHLPPA